MLLLQTHIVGSSHFVQVYNGCTLFRVFIKDKYLFKRNL